MRKLKIKIQVFRNGKVAGTLIRDKGGVRMHGICGETIPDNRPLRQIVSALATEGCVMKIINGMDLNLFMQCCCFRCDALIGPESSPDCACEEAPIFYAAACFSCPKRVFCDVPKNPHLYQREEVAV